MASRKAFSPKGEEASLQHALSGLRTKRSKRSNTNTTAKDQLQDQQQKVRGRNSGISSSLMEFSRPNEDPEAPIFEPPESLAVGAVDTGARINPQAPPKQESAKRGSRPNESQSHPHLLQTQLGFAPGEQGSSSTHRQKMARTSSPRRSMCDKTQADNTAKPDVKLSSARTNPSTSSSQTSASIQDSASSTSASLRPASSLGRPNTRHQSLVSPQAHQEFITFSSGLDGTLVATASSAPPQAHSSSTSTSSNRKRAFVLRHSDQQTTSQSDSQSRSRSKIPRLASNSSLSEAAAGAPASTRRISPRRTTQSIPFTRKSKMSTSQKISNPRTKDLADKDMERDAEDSHDTAKPSVPAPLVAAASQADSDIGQNNSQITTDHETSLEQHKSNADEQATADAVGIAKEEGGVEVNEDENENNENSNGNDEDEDDDEDEDEEDEEDGYNPHRQADQDGSMSGMVSGISSRLKGILTNLRAHEDPSLQLIALQDLAVLLSVSTEDTLAGYFSCDTFVKELVILLKGTGDGDDNADMMLLACRCLSNLMEAMPASLGSVVYGGAVAAMCEKLIVIQYIDLAEQSLTTLEKISSEYPHAVVKEGGLAAVLTYMDFFSTNVQRTAVKTAANCCRGMHHDNIAMVQDILPNLENIIQYSDQKIVEQACLCFVRLADSFRSNAAHLQSIITEPVLRAMLSLLSPNANVIVGPPVYTHLLHFFSTIAERSPALGSALLEMDVVDTLFLVLTGVPAPPTDIEAAHGTLQVPNVGSRSKDQVSEILGIVTQLLPTLPKADPLFDTEYRHLALKQLEQQKQDQTSGDETPAVPAAAAEVVVDMKRELLESNSIRVRRLGQILFPTLIEVYSSTVHYQIRQRAILGLVKLTYFSEEAVLRDVLKEVELASFLAVILSQQEHQSLVVAALQIADILMTKLPSIYRHFFEREGVIFEISKLAFLGVEKSLSSDLEKAAVVDKPLETPPSNADGKDTVAQDPSTSCTTDIVQEANKDDSQPSVAPSATVNQRLVGLMADLRSARGGADRARSMEDQLNAIQSELESAWGSDPASNGDTVQPAYASRAALDQLRMLHRLIVGGSIAVAAAPADERGLGSGKTKDWIFERAKIIVDACQAAGTNDIGQAEGNSVLADLKRMGEGLRESTEVAAVSLNDLAGYLSRVGANGISSFEFLSSGLSQSLLEYLTNMESSGLDNQDSRIRRFIETFMATTLSSSSKSAALPPFSQLVKKLQESLTRMETFEVETAQTSLGEPRNPSSSLATQVRLKLTPEDGTEVSPGLQNLVVSIHAIATFRTLDEYLRPRLKPTLSSPEKSENGTKNPSGADQKHSTATNGPPTTRRSSRLLNLTDPSGDTRKSDADERMEASQDKKDDSSDDSSDMGEGDIEEMDYELEQHTGAQATKGGDNSPVEVDTDDLKPSGTAKSGGDETLAGASDRSKSPTSASSTKSKSSSDSTTPWHIQFSLHGSPLNTDMTVYGALHNYERRNAKGPAFRPVWSSIYPIKYKRVDAAVPEQQPVRTVNRIEDSVDLTLTSHMPDELSQQADYSPILGLLRVLQSVNDDWTRFYKADDQLPTVAVQTLDSQEFINSKISAKVSRQLEEPLIVASSCLPNWTVGLVKGFPFLFPFETRYTYLQSTSFGFSRSLMRWQNQQQRAGQADQRDDSQTFLGRIQRQKVRISRQKALESAVRVMELYGSHRAMLEVEYFEEVGTGLGPTLEFYSVVSKEFCKKSLKLWRFGDSESTSEYVSAPHGLFPRPMGSSPDENDKKILQLFKSLGQFIAKAMLDSRIIDVPLSYLFVSQIQGRCLMPSLQLVKLIDPVLAQSLQSLQAFVKEKKRVYSLNLPSKERERALSSIDLNGSKLEDMSLDFTLPGYPDIKLKTGGDAIPVTIYNIEEYVQLTLEKTVGSGVEAQVASFKSGFNCVFPIHDLAGFRSEELVRLFGSGEEDWTYETLVDSVKADHGFSSESRAFKNLLCVMSEFNVEERRQFLQFITGSPKLPIGGFKNLHPAFTVVCKPFEAPLKADDYLPSVMTCANYLKMPNYSSKEVALAKFKMAYEEGQGSFHLS